MNDPWNKIRDILKRFAEELIDPIEKLKELHKEYIRALKAAMEDEEDKKECKKGYIKYKPNIKKFIIVREIIHPARSNL